LAGTWGTVIEAATDEADAGNYPGGGVTAATPGLWLATAYYAATGLNVGQLDLIAKNSGETGIADFAGMLTNLNGINAEIMTCHNLGKSEYTTSRRMLGTAAAAPSGCACGNSANLQNEYLETAACTSNVA